MDPIVYNDGVYAEDAHGWWFEVVRDDGIGFPSLVARPLSPTDEEVDARAVTTLSIVVVEGGVVRASMSLGDTAGNENKDAYSGWFPEVPLDVLARAIALYRRAFGAEERPTLRDGDHVTLDTEDGPVEAVVVAPVKEW